MALDVSSCQYISLSLRLSVLRALFREKQIQLETAKKILIRGKQMEKFRVMMKIEVNGLSDNDPEITKDVIASSPNEALDKARELVKIENPELNYMKIWFWAIERRYD